MSPSRWPCRRHCERRWLKGHCSRQARQKLQRGWTRPDLRPLQEPFPALQEAPQVLNPFSVKGIRGEHAHKYMLTFPIMAIGATEVDTESVGSLSNDY